MGNAKRRKTKENDNYGIYFYLIASKMGFTCSNAKSMLVCFVFGACELRSPKPKKKKKRSWRKHFTSFYPSGTHVATKMDPNTSFRTQCILTQIGDQCPAYINSHYPKWIPNFLCCRRRCRLPVCRRVSPSVMSTTHSRKKNKTVERHLPVPQDVWFFSRCVQMTQHCRLLDTLLFTICCHWTFLFVVRPSSDVRSNWMR